MARGGGRQGAQGQRPRLHTQQAQSLGQRAEAEHKHRVEVLRLASSRAIDKIVAKAQTKQPDAAFWRLAGDALADGSWHETIASVVKRRGWVERKQRPEEILQRRTPALSPGELRPLLVELLPTRGAVATWGPTGFGRSPTQACKL